MRTFLLFFLIFLRLLDISHLKRDKNMENERNVQFLSQRWLHTMVSSFFSKKRVDTLHNNFFLQEDKWTIMPVPGIGQNDYQCYCTTKALILHRKSIAFTMQYQRFLYFIE